MLFFELFVPHEWTGKTVGQLDIRKKYDINIMAVKTNGILNLKSEFRYIFISR